MNTHELLKDYHGHPNYPAIAQRAAELAKTELSRSYILEQIQRQFGAPPTTLGMKEKHAPFKVFGELGSLIPYNAYDQMKTAMSIPPALNGALMPDAHHGYGVPIGGVVVLDNALSPGYIGFDISCEVQVTIFDILPEDFMRDRGLYAECLLQETSFGVGAGGLNRDHEVMDDPLWDEIKVLKALKQKAQHQLGSSGGGNHFADLMVGRVLAHHPGIPMSEGDEFVALVTHSGSRGAGWQAAKHYIGLAEKHAQSVARGIPSGYGWLDADSEEGIEYWKVMKLMQRYADANHELIHWHFAETARLDATFTARNAHNLAWQVGNYYVHRKGATPAETGVLGIIPGSSGTPSFLVRGLGNPDSIFSSSHGAGRPFSRTEAKKNHDEQLFDDWMQNEDILHFGLAPDETMMAYKNIHEVIDAQAGILIEPLAEMFPKVVLMGGKS